jgi:phospholipid/cholesterol/gamma-HCH transport system permease protein
MTEKNPKLTYDKANSLFRCTGDWSVLKLDLLYKKFSESELPKGEKTTIDSSAIESFDSAGALTLIRCIELLQKKNNEVQCLGLSKTHQKLFDLVQSKRKELSYQIPKPPKYGLLYRIGKESVHKLMQVDGLIILVGDITTRLFEAVGSLRRFQFPSIVSNIQSAGIQALPIVALLSFLIGVVLAYQMGLQLQTYGANIYIAYLSGMAIFREFGPLITAIIVAGRTSSAFTAQIGSMKVNEEIDALMTMGLSPTELLVLPKVLGLLIMFPLLIFWADFFSVLGAMIMSKSMLDINFYDFLQRLRDSVGFSQLRLGLYKAPAFAVIIALVGCFQGFRVQANADSIGSQTTRSVVQALFMIIIADAIYSVVYSWMKL